MGIKYKIKTDPDLSQVAAAYRPISVKRIDKFLETLSRVIHKNITDEAPRRTGDLIKSIVRKKRKIFEYDIFVDRRRRGGKYEASIRLGVRGAVNKIGIWEINPILPRKKKALWWPGARHPVKAVYNHPGIKPNPYWDRGIDKSQRDIQAAEDLIGAEIERKLSGR